MIVYSINAALAASRIDRVVVTTDDEEIATIARAAGAEVPFIRPVELAADDTPTLPVIMHALEELAMAGWEPELVCLLQPTFPFRSPEEIDACIDKLVSENADCVISLHRVPHRYNPHWIYLQRADGTLGLATGEAEPIARRQELPPAFRRSGSIYVTRTGVIRRKGSLYGDRIVGYETSEDNACDIDSPEDWLRAEELLVTSRSNK